MTPAQWNRVEGLGMIMALHCPESAEYDLQGDAPEIAANIRKLAALGRTERWRAAIDRWAAMVEETPQEAPWPEDGRRQYLRWAFLQGAIYAGHAT